MHAPCGDLESPPSAAFVSFAMGRLLGGEPIRGEACKLSALSRLIVGVDRDMEGQNYRSILKRVGIVLVAVGLVDIAWMIYCIVHRLAYQSSLNLFAVIAGVLLMRGSIRAAAVVRWFSVFFLTAGLGALFVWPAAEPLDLTLTRIRLNPGGHVAAVALLVFILVLFYWAIKELGREEVRVASESAGLKRRDMRLPIGLGIALVVGLGVSLNVFLHGVSAERAKSMAAKEVGPGYRFHVRSLAISSVGDKKSVSGVVTAWNDKEIREIAVHWDEART